MTDNNDNNENIIESEEEDYEIYFLQPASSPYNIKEKLEAANKALFEEKPDLDTRPLKVKFKENLVDYEPDLTDDDVQSIESYNEVDYLLEQELSEEITSPPPLPITNKIELNIFTPTLHITEECEEESENYEEEEENSIKMDEDCQKKNFAKDNSAKLEEIEIEENVFDQDQFEERLDYENIDSYMNNYDEDIDDMSNMSSDNLSIESMDPEDMEDIENIFQTDESESRETTSTTRTITTTSSRKTLSVLGRKLSHVDCKSHCIERLDSELDLTISKLQITEKPQCPTLKLIKRKCCEKNPIKTDQKLPCYSGLRSEYGLTLQQLESRQKRRELTKIREDKRKRLMEEYRHRKIQQNEEIFCQWLKNLQKRKQDQKKKEIKSISPKILNISSNGLERTERIERPKTAYPLIPSHNVKKPKRPNTSTACVYIQVPRNVLNKGLHVGDIVVTNSEQVTPKKGLHILTIS